MVWLVIQRGTDLRLFAADRRTLKLLSGSRSIKPRIERSFTFSSFPWSCHPFDLHVMGT